MTARVITVEALGRLLESLVLHGYQVVGPTIRDGAIVLGEIGGLDDLPAGWSDEQGPARYRLRRRADRLLFGYTVGPHAWKRYLFPPAARVWRIRREDGNFAVELDTETPPKRAFLGVRACELHAIAIQDRIFLEGPHADPAYRARRDRSLLIAVNCRESGGTCFCASMGTGPRATAGFDLALTELLDADRHEFLVEIAGDRAAGSMKGVPSREAAAADLDEAARISASAAARMGRALDTDGLHDALLQRLEHPRWDAVAARCLACTNCTMVCPTCFCHTVEDTTDLTGAAERHRRWDSCFSQEYSYIHGGFVRATIRARYRQWLTHKLATWVDQFGTFGCVGCGRCITWCPAGIDLTEEARALRVDEAQGPAPDD
jgi:formate hydrogenlyase subunit 6/NADH:ubiquinone oxidoreductase subunit I